MTWSMLWFLVAFGGFCFSCGFALGHHRAILWATNELLGNALKGAKEGKK